VCYQSEAIVIDISSCAKEVMTSTRFKIGLRYATNSVDSSSYFSNQKEILSNYGDCLVTLPNGNWAGGNLTLGSSEETVPLGTTGIDVVGDYLYTVSVNSPQLRIYKSSSDVSAPPLLVGSSTGSGIRLNDIDVIRDLGTGRLYAYVMQHTTSSQLAVFDVTDSQNPQLLTQLPLFNVASNGSFPQGWRVFAYGGELFVISRETTGPELHIFSLLNPRLPVEKTSAVINLNRTVNDMVVRDEVVGGNSRRFLYLAASSDLKEVGIYDVTGTIPIEVTAINLIGSADAISLYLTGNTLYVGRKSSTASELYAFDASKLVRGELDLKGSSEVGTEVLALGGVGKALIVGTGKTGEELQLWNPEVTSWSTSVVNSGRISTHNLTRLAPLGFDIAHDNLYLVSQSVTQPESIVRLFAL
jgi:hypothetical protein